MEVSFQFTAMEEKPQIDFLGHLISGDDVEQPADRDFSGLQAVLDAIVAP